MSNAERGYYMVKPQQQTEAQLKVVFGKDVVAVGWSDIDFSSFTNADDLIKEVD